jgi:hypothetical protein
MSNEVRTWANEQQLPGVPKSILVYLGDRMNDAVGYAWPSTARIAKDTGWHRRTVAKAVKYLVAEGFIATRRQYYVGDHSLGSNRYYFPALGTVPPEGTAFPITGGYDAEGKWNEVYEYEGSGVFSDESDSPGQ